MSVIQKIEEDIVERLKKFGGVNWLVQPFPDDVTNFDTANIQNAVLVHYSASDFKGQSSSAFGTQNRTIRFAVHYLTRSLSGHHGRYSEMETIRDAIQGFKTQGLELVLESDKLLAQNEGLWHWLFEVSCELPSINRREHHRITPHIKG